MNCFINSFSTFWIEESAWDRQLGQWWWETDGKTATNADGRRHNGGIRKKRIVFLQWLTSLNNDDSSHYCMYTWVLRVCVAFIDLFNFDDHKFSDFFFTDFFFTERVQPPIKIGRLNFSAKMTLLGQKW